MKRLIVTEGDAVHHSDHVIDPRNVVDFRRQSRTVN